MRLLLVNGTDAEVGFAASDSRLSIIQEAKDSDGNWKAIEFLPSSWCGNSYHRVFLPAKHYWEFSAPLYTGKMRTKLRFALPISDTVTIYSNEFEGSVNSGQFGSRKEGYTSRGLMDPYDE